MTRFWLRLSSLSLALFPLVLHAADAHVHGTARLDVAIDGGTLTLMLHAPAESLVGFEHAPRTDRERTAVAKAKQSLEQPGTLFVPSPGAGCTPTGAKLESPLFDADAKRKHSHKHDSKHADEPGHADVTGQFLFHCRDPQALREVDVRLFSAFPRLKKLEVKIAGPRGQTARTLTPRQTKASW